MNKSQLLMDIELEVKTLQAHLKRIRSSDYPLNMLDVDMLKEKVRMIYDRIIELETLTEKRKGVHPVGEEKVEPEPIQEEKPATPIQQTPDGESADTEPSQPEDNGEATVDLETKKESETVSDSGAAELLLFPEEETIAKEAERESVAENTPRKVQEEINGQQEVIKTTLDLFSEPEGKSLGDTLTPSEEPTVAERIQKSQISDLRQAIGINEKFQILNELFNGDLTKYNKAIDELNSFSGLDGAKTYLFEMHVENQWDEDNPALLLLNQLLERKFA